MESHAVSDFRVLFVGHLFPQELEAKIIDQPIPPVQTQRFGLALLDALMAGFGEKVEVLSVAPLLDYPACRLLISPMASWRVFGRVQATMIPYINILGLKHLIRFIGTLLFVGFWSLRNCGMKRLIVMHGVQSCKIWGSNMGQALMPAVTLSYLTDDLGLSLRGESAFKKKIRRIDVFLMKRGLQRVSGVITMTPWLAAALAPQKPSLVMNAILNTVDPRVISSESVSDNVFTIVYAGGLSHDYGIDLLLQAFRQATRPDWRLVIAGSGDLAQRVQAAARSDPRIEYKGFLDAPGMAELYRIADVLVNPRLLSSSLAQMAFPSKIVEYLATGKPVVSTDLPAFDEQFRKQLVIAHSDTPEELARCLDDVASWSPDARKRWRAQTQAFLRANLSPAVQGAKLREFVQSLVFANNRA